ncbi:MAG: hypothetical protein QOK15_1998 [Nocardioidaceae bacterium]|jgi:hypothetical protein|nr:hypothetical protein [Nocardioidaceae bacterium]
MAAARHRREDRRPVHRLLRRLAGPAALVTVAAGVFVAAHGLSGPATPSSQALDLSAGAGAVASPMNDPSSRDRFRAVSRSMTRTAVTRPVTLQPRAVGHRYATAPLNVWTAPREQGPRVGLVQSGTKLGVTGQQVGHWAEVLVAATVHGKGTAPRVRWVNADYLAVKEPVADSSGASTGSAASTSGISSAPCPDGSATESGLTSSAVRLFRAVCAAFPPLTTYGGYDPHGEHASGRAIDFMISDPALGQAVASWVQAHAAELDIYDVIWQQHIWTPVRASEGWRFMPDRGSPTANHDDHVHVSVN